MKRDEERKDMSEMPIEHQKRRPLVRVGSAGNPILARMLADITAGGLAWKF